MLGSPVIFDFSQNQYTADDFLSCLKEYDRQGYTCYVGTDSKIIKNRISLATVVCFHQAGSSGRIFFTRNRVNRKLYPNLKSRMFLEAFQSLETAQELQGFLSKPIEVHLDVGETSRSKTAAYETELQMMITAQGFLCAIKPDSFASSAVADKVLRGL